jgi:hypothetical protein
MSNCNPIDMHAFEEQLYDAIAVRGFAPPVRRQLVTEVRDALGRLTTGPERWIVELITMGVLTRQLPGNYGVADVQHLVEHLMDDCEIR